jgi:predicted metalloendopeptidase
MTKTMSRKPATDSHAPPCYRVLGPLSNFAEFFSAFGCSNGADGKSFARSGSDVVTIW